MPNNKIADPRLEAQNLLAQMLKAGAAQLYILDRMLPLPETKAAMSAQSEVLAEEISILAELIEVVAKAGAKTIREQAVARAEELLPGLRGWKAPKSDWLGSGLERLPVGLVPLLLRRKISWTEKSLAEGLKCCRSSKGWHMLANHQEVIQAFVNHVIRLQKSEVLAPVALAELLKLRSKLQEFAANEKSQLANWAQKQANAIGYATGSV